MSSAANQIKKCPVHQTREPTNPPLFKGGFLFWSFCPSFCLKYRKNTPNKKRGLRKRGLVDSRQTKRKNGCVATRFARMGYFSEFEAFSLLLPANKQTLRIYKHHSSSRQSPTLMNLGCLLFLIKENAPNLKMKYPIFAHRVANRPMSGLVCLGGCSIHWRGGTGWGKRTIDGDLQNPMLECFRRGCSPHSTRNRELATTTAQTAQNKKIFRGKLSPYSSSTMDVNMLEMLANQRIVL